jgi:hypothetical protein
MLSRQYNRTFDRLEHQIAASETNKRHREHQLATWSLSGNYLLNFHGCGGLLNSQTSLVPMYDYDMPKLLIPPFVKVRSGETREFTLQYLTGEQKISTYESCRYHRKDTSVVEPGEILQFETLFLTGQTRFPTFQNI